MQKNDALAPYALKNYMLPEKGEKMKIYVFPHPHITKKSLPVTKFDESLEELVKKMLFTMYHYPGVGLAAPQVGVHLNLIIVDMGFDLEHLEEDDSTPLGHQADKSVVIPGYRLKNFGPIIFINPRILKSSEETRDYEEACMSLPGISEKITRPSEVELEFEDLKGETHRVMISDEWAVCIQHEMDHLEGVTFLDHISSFKKSLHRKKLQKYLKAGG